MPTLQAVNFVSKNIRWILPVCFVMASFGIAWLLTSFTVLSNEQAWKESNLFWIVYGTVTTIAVLAVRVYPTKVGIILYALGIGIIAGLVAGFNDIYLLKLWAKNDIKHLYQVQSTMALRFILSFAITIPAAIITGVHKQLMEVKARLGRHSSVEDLLKEAELFKLRQQLQPHFLYNSLNSINSLILIDPDKAQDMVGKLSDFLRSSVKKDTNEALPISEELSYLEAYLSIESIRFGDRLKIEYQHDYTDDARMPPFLLQPLIENAIKFGLYGNTGNVVISIHIRLEESVLFITISNPFDALTQPQKGTGFGLEGIRRRLFLLYGRDDLVNTTSENDLFITTLKIPQLHVQSTAD